MKNRILVRRPNKTTQMPDNQYVMTVTVGEDADDLTCDIPKLIMQWENCLDRFAGTGWEVEVLPGAAPHFAGILINQAAAVYRTVALMGQGSQFYQAGEYALVRSALLDRGIAVANPSTATSLSGSDVEQVGSTVHVARSSDTNAHGVAEVRRLLTPLGLRVIAVPLTGMRLLKGVSSQLPDGTTIGEPSAFEDVRVFRGFIPAPEPAGASLVSLSDNEVLVSASARGTASLLQNLGYRVIQVDISEFEKFGASISSLALRLTDHS